MAQKVLVQLVDDLDGTEIGDGKGETVSFGLDGREYEIDLTEKNAKALRKALEPYLGVARKTGGRRRGGRSTSGTDPKAVRAWAASAGIDVPARGRIPNDVVEQYHAAGN